MRPRSPGACAAGVDVLVTGAVVAGVVATGGGAGAGVQDSDTPTTGSLIGREIDDNGVPGATLTVKDSFAPPSTVTLITHGSAEADGTAASPATHADAAAAPIRTLLPTARD